jgi:pyruvate/2-oxoglutarate dehydrogenase complex dihydrolipoamide dehydrogenase (E3) component
VRTDAHLETAVDGSYGAGDVTGRLPFTHAADAMGRVAAGNALLARVGIPEPEAATRGGRVAYLPLEEVDRAGR